MNFIYTPNHEVLNFEEACERPSIFTFYREISQRLLEEKFTEIAKETEFVNKFTNLLIHISVSGSLSALLI